MADMWLICSAVKCRVEPIKIPSDHSHNRRIAAFLVFESRSATPPYRFFSPSAKPLKQPSGSIRSPRNQTSASTPPQLEEARKVSASPENNLPRIAFKMATGSGKTVVMAALIAYHYFNRAEYRNDVRFADNFRHSAGITIRDRWACCAWTRGWVWMQRITTMSATSYRKAGARKCRS